MDNVILQEQLICFFANASRVNNVALSAPCVFSYLHYSDIVLDILKPICAFSTLLVQGMLIVHSE